MSIKILIALVCILQVSYCDIVSDYVTLINDFINKTNSFQYPTSAKDFVAGNLRQSGNIIIKLALQRKL